MTAAAVWVIVAQLVTFAGVVALILLGLGLLRRI